VTEQRDDHGANSRAYRTHLDAVHAPLQAYGALSFTAKGVQSEGTRETAYRLHLMDMATHRLVPHLLGVSARDCDHLACELVMVNSLAAGYMIEMGWAGEHSSRLAHQLLEENGFGVVNI